MANLLMGYLFIYVACDSLMFNDTLLFCQVTQREMWAYPIFVLTTTLQVGEAEKL